MLESDRTNNNLNYIINKVSAGRIFVTTTPAATADFSGTSMQKPQTRNNMKASKKSQALENIIPLDKF